MADVKSEYYEFGFGNGHRKGMYDAYKRILQMITKERAEIDDVYLFARANVNQYEEERASCPWQE